MLFLSWWCLGTKLELEYGIERRICKFFSSLYARNELHISVTVGVKNDGGRREIKMWARSASSVE